MIAALPDGRSRGARNCALLAVANAEHCEADAAGRRNSRKNSVRHLEEAVRLRLIADVPLGAFLSGGIDSSAVVAMMARAGGGKVKTFSIGFSAKEYDETGYARIVAERYGTEHEEFIVEPDAVAVIAAAGLALRRAVRRSVGDPDLLCRRNWRAAKGHGGAERRWRRRVLSRLPALSGDAPFVAA